MTGPKPDTPREEQIRGFFATMSTEGQETLTAARGANDRQAAIIAALETKVAGMAANEVDEETLEEFRGLVGAFKQTQDDATAAFDQVGVPPTPPEDIPSVDEIVARARKGKGKGKGGR